MFMSGKPGKTAFSLAPNLVLSGRKLQGRKLVGNFIGKYLEALKPQ